MTAAGHKVPQALGIARYPSLRGRRVFITGGATPGWVMTERQMRMWLTPEGEAEIARNQCLPDRLQAEDVAAMVL